MSLEVIILAAGQGTRMRSPRPKVLQRLAGRPLLAHAIATAGALNAAVVHVVLGHGAATVRAHFPDTDINWVLQAEQRGTGHAVATALPAVASDATVLVMYADVPLIGIQTLRALATAASSALAILTARVTRPAGLGRILRARNGAVTGIREERDASEAERTIEEINTGFIAAPAARLTDWLARVDADNAQGEIYLTDIVRLAAAERYPIVDRPAATEWEILGVNSQPELARLERIYQLNQADRLMAAGLCLADPARFDLRGRLHAGHDCEIDINVVLEGDVQLGDGVRIGANCVLRDARLGDGVTVHSHTVIDNATIASGCQLGPFARIRPGTTLAADVRVGNFVEVKRSAIAVGSKINHLAYVGDSTVGAGVNIGAGTITCNYDGANKHRTEIDDGAFIGSNTVLVAPVKVGREAVIGAGSVISRNAPDGKLTLSRVRQTTLDGWRRPVKRSK